VRQVAGESRSIHVCMSLMSRQMMTLHVHYTMYVYCKVVECLLRVAGKRVLEAGRMNSGPTWLQERFIWRREERRGRN
jgi:hypothetical protein